MMAQSMRPTAFGRAEIIVEEWRGWPAVDYEMLRESIETAIRQAEHVARLEGARAGLAYGFEHTENGNRVWEHYDSSEIWRKAAEIAARLEAE